MAFDELVESLLPSRVPWFYFLSVIYVAPTSGLSGGSPIDPCSLQKSAIRNPQSEIPRQSAIGNFLPLPQTGN
jgi:hypothetical protein